MMDNNTTSQNSGEEVEQDIYYERIEPTIVQLENEIEEKLNVKAALINLNKQVKNIDCNHGSASINVEDGEVKVQTFTYDFNDEVRSLVNDYNWVYQKEIQYEPESETLHWMLRTPFRELTSGGEFNQGSQN